MSEFILTLDFGTGTGKSFIFSVTGELIANSSKEWKYNENWKPFGENKVPIFDFDASEFWNILCNLVKQSINSSKINPKDIVAVSSTSMREGCVFFDKDGKELYAGPNIDARAFMEGMEIQGKLKEKLQHITGHLPAIIFMPARLAWFKKNKPEIYEKIYKFLMINDWILFRLTGEYISEPSNASESGIYDVHKREWSKELIELLDFPEHILPALKEPGTLICEGIDPDIARKMGISPKIKVVVGGADTECALLGTKTTKPGQTCIVAGTSTPVQMVTSKPCVDEKFRIWTCCHVVPNMWTVDSDAGETGHYLRWIKKVFNFDYPDIDNLAEQASPGSGGFFANFGGTVANYGGLTGLGYGGFLIPLPIISSDVFQAEFCRGLLENFAYIVKKNCAQVEEVAGLEIGAGDVALTGGQAKSNIFTSILCNVLGTPIKTFTIKEGSGLGSAVLASVGVGIYKNINDAAENMIHLEKIFEPDIKNTKTYRKLYKKWNKVHLQFLNIKK